MLTTPDPDQTHEFGRGVDFGKTSTDYAKYRKGFPETFFERLAEYGVGAPGQRILDLGTGTGTIARALAQRGADVVALDPAVAQLDAARGLDTAAGVSVEYVVGAAEALPFDDAAFDIVTAGQCWHWFDRAAATAEVSRVLRAGGRVVIAHFDWIPLPGNVAHATEALILSYNPDWALSGGTGIHPVWFADLGTGGFTQLESFTFDVDVAYSHEAWRGRVRASAGIKASLPADAVERFDHELDETLRARFPRDPLSVLHRVSAVFGTKSL
ncbi:class I SAM-dependent methyltransferase [Haliangium sp.]|uniref:class I SAM-dependent methyltransferase n=1 Tax=Haliangium sp. TaxID=2663208 RepID=UPI003D0BA397